MFDTLIDQNEAISRLLTLFYKDTVPHALLFTGISGVGKRTAACAFAMALNCSRALEKKIQMSQPDEFEGLHPCLECRSCKKILSGNHPDIIEIKPSGTLIKIAQIRDLCSKLLIKPNEAITRVVVIHDAETMNNESSNALLKSLEEPPDKTMFILISGQASDLLPTIVSRCQHIGFSPISRKSIEAWLLSRDVDPSTAEIIASMAQGSIGRANAFLGKAQTLKSLSIQRSWLADHIEILGQGSLSAGLLFAEKLSGKKEAALDALDFLTTFIRDLAVYKYLPETILNKDLETSIARISNRFTLPGLLSMSAHIQKARQSIRANAALRLSLETMAFNLSRV